MVHLNGHTLAIMLALAFTVGAVFGRLTEMVISRPKQAQLLRQLELMNERLASMGAKPKLRVVSSKPKEP